MRSVVTGSSGFVGSHLVDYLSRKVGHLCGLLDIADGIDITNREQVFDFFERFKPHTVYHLAAQINPKRSEEDRELDYKVNVLGTLNIIDAMIECGTDVLVFTSSDAVNNPISNYGVTKRTAEEYILKYTRQGKIKGKIARFSSVYGTGRGAKGVVNRFIKQVWDNTPITLYTEALGSKRDFIYVSDCVRALEIIQTKGHIGEIYNVGTGTQHSINEVAQLIKDLWNGFCVDLEQTDYAKIERIEGGNAAVIGSDFDTTSLARLGFVAHTDLYKGVDHLITMEGVSRR